MNDGHSLLSPPPGNFTVDMADKRSAVQDEIKQKRPFHSDGAEVAVGILRTAAVLERHYNQIVTKRGITIQQYNVLRILRGAGAAGMPTLVIRDRMIHEAPGITRLVDRLEQAGLARRERQESDRRQVLCYITDKGIQLLADLDAEVIAADEAAVSMLDSEQRQQLTELLTAVRSGHARANVPSPAAASSADPF
jgi:MarR family transcriptional regulator, organic hydroperoxide resistance regulator